MASLFSDYEYDVFISYRQNDNKYDGWVSEFIEKLKQELNATVKDKLNIYFDENPTDGIRETDQVDASISSKIKSLIFIPIVSQTYCDTSSFAWQQEFMAFKNEATGDQFGTNIRLANGNVASRILPVKIHDIESEDIRMLEKELDGTLRSIEFIYRDAGVNRPLRSVDDMLMEGNRVLYRNQINKVANAVKDVINGLKKINRGETSPFDDSISITEASPQLADSFSTSLPDTIKVAVINEKKPGIYLAWTSNDLRDQRDEMSLILQKAGFNVYPSIDCPADDDEFKSRVSSELAKCSCSLHMLSGTYGRRFEEDDDISFPRYQFEQAKSASESPDAEFHTFIWHIEDQEKEIKSAQREFIKYIRNTITRNMMFSNSLGPMQLVDDIRVIMMKDTKVELEASDTDIFFIFNQQDEVDAGRITDMISTEYPVEIMNIQPDGEAQYREMSAQQIPRSKLAVVYFKYAADWALPFIKQVWKQVGGASSPTPLMLIGEDDPVSNRARYFKAPKVVSSIVPSGNVSEEVKKIYVKVIDLK